MRKVFNAELFVTIRSHEIQTVPQIISFSIKCTGTTIDEMDVTSKIDKENSKKVSFQHTSVYFDHCVHLQHTTDFAEDLSQYMYLVETQRSQ